MLLYRSSAKLVCITCQMVRPMSGLPFRERKLEILTCKHLFPKEAKNAGLKFEVTYIDEKLRNTADNPVVLFLPGAPGSYLDYKGQIPEILENGARIIAPNFPDLPALLKHKSPKCRNTPENKSALIRDFLKSIGVSRIDMMVTHSSAVYTGLRLYRFPEKLNIRSMVMINPLGHWHTTTRPAWFFWTMSEMMNYRLGYAFLKVFGKAILDRVSPVEVPNIEAPLLGLASIRSFNMKEVREGYEEIAKKKPPLLFLFSNNDRLIETRVSHQMLDILGSKKEDWWYYDENGRLQTKGKEDDWIRVLNFKKGSHYSFRKHAQVVSQEVASFLKRVMNQELLTNIQQPLYRQATAMSEDDVLKSTTCFQGERRLTNQI